MKTKTILEIVVICTICVATIMSGCLSNENEHAPNVSSTPDNVTNISDEIDKVCPAPWLQNESEMTDNNVANISNETDMVCQAPWLQTDSNVTNISDETNMVCKCS